MSFPFSLSCKGNQGISELIHKGSELWYQSKAPYLDPASTIVELLWRNLQKLHVTFSVSANHAYCHDIQPGSGPENSCLCQCNWESLQSVQWGWFDLYINRPRPLLVVSHPSLLMYPLLEKAYHKFTCNHKIFFSSDIIVDSILN